MEKRRRQKLCPEITEPDLRGFLDMVPIIRQMNEAINEKLDKNGERLVIELPGRALPVYLHRAREKKAPVVFEYHGGGYVFGSAAADDGICAELCEKSGCNVIAVDYRLAPETRFPGQLDDAWEVMLWVREHAAELSADADHMAVMGFSAGANLAAAVALLAAERGADFLKGQVLHYPFLDYTHSPEEKDHFDADVDPAMIHGFTRCFCREEEYGKPLVSPVCAGKEALARVAPALIVSAERDALREEAFRYHELLQSAGASSEYHVSPGAHHCYIEDTYNPAVYEQTTLEQKRKLHSPDFRTRAREAMELSARFLNSRYSPDIQK